MNTRNVCEIKIKPKNSDNDHMISGFPEQNITF